MAKDWRVCQTPGCDKLLTYLDKYCPRCGGIVSAKQKRCFDYIEEVGRKTISDFMVSTMVFAIVVLLSILIFGLEMNMVPPLVFVVFAGIFAQAMIYFSKQNRKINLFWKDLSRETKLKI